MRVIDSQVHWIDHQRLSPIPSRTEELALNDGSTSTFVAARRWGDYIRPNFGLQQETPSGPEASYQLAWFGRGSLGSSPSSMDGFSLSRAQAACVSRLFQGLADGKPAVAEEELLKAAQSKTMSELFPGGVGETPEQTWGSLFVRGDQPNTWRLNVPEPTSPPLDSPEMPAAKPSIIVEFRRAENQPGEGLTEATIAGTTQKVYVRQSSDATNEDIAEARAALDDQQHPAVEITFTEAGAKKMAKLTEEHLNKPLAILVDGQLVSAPLVVSSFGNRARITGNFTQEEVDRIVRGITGK
jgi:hypothetical protein